jgi:hypothetical protein
VRGFVRGAVRVRRDFALASPALRTSVFSLGLSKFSRYTTRTLPICWIACAASRSQIFSIQSSRASRSSVAARILISSWAFNERSISAITSSVSPFFSPMITTGVSLCACERNSLRRDADKLAIVEV